MADQWYQKALVVWEKHGNEHGAAITWGGFVHNLVPVTLGNIVGGAAFVGGAYWFSNLPLRLGRVEAAPARQPEGAMAEA